MSIALLDPSDDGYKAALRRLQKSQRANAFKEQDRNWTPFRAAEKRYMAKYPPPDMSGVLDLAAGDLARATELAQSKWKGDPSATATTRLSCANGAVAYTVDA